MIYAENQPASVHGFLMFLLTCTVLHIIQSQHYTLYLRDFGTEFLVLLRLFQEMNKLQNLQLGLFTACDVLQPDVNAVSDHLRFGFSHPEDVVSSPVLPSSRLPLPRAEHEQAKQPDQRE